jgi:hypothetical protein
VLTEINSGTEDRDEGTWGLIVVLQRGIHKIFEI